MAIFKSYKEKRENKNYLIYDSLKLQLADCPNLEFNKYVLDFVKTFIKCGKLEKQRNSDTYNLFLYNKEYTGGITIKTTNKKKEVIISLSPILKNSSLKMSNKVVFNQDNITMLNIVTYKGKDEILLESKSYSVFKNTCPILNSLGDNNLVCLETSDTELKNNKKKESTGVIRIKNNGQALGKMWNSEEQKNIYFKDKDIIVTFEDFLMNGFTALKQAVLSDEEFDENNQFLEEWYQENYEPQKKPVPNKKLS